MFNNSSSYVTKVEAENRHQYFTDDMIVEAKPNDDIEVELKKALKKEEFFLCYQPILDTRTRKIVSMEALIRWRHPIRGVISPQEFIPIAEETGIINPLGEWVIYTSCKQLKTWHELGFEDCSLSINISMLQLQQQNFAETVKEILVEVKLSPKYVELEITESMFIDLIPSVKRNISKLRELGVRISIDDFGTGFNCFSSIQSIDIDTLKIDRTFTTNIKNHVNSAIIDAIITLGHEINAKVTAEGVEKEEQFEFLREKGCDMVQGYYFSKPILPKEVLKFCERMNTMR